MDTPQQKNAPPENTSFPFSTRAALVAVVLLVIPVVWSVNQWRLATERRAMKALIVARGGQIRSGPTGTKHFGWTQDGPAKPMLPYGDWRRSVFDYVAEIDAPNSFSESEKARIRVLFPEATLFREDHWELRPVSQVLAIDATDAAPK